MFRHKGKARRLIHNLKLASLLSFVAGIVNVVGLFAVNVLTTNVTGHFAYFSDELAKKNFTDAPVYLLYIFCFLFGAFVSNTIVEYFLKANEKYVNIMPVYAEVFLLLLVTFIGINYLYGSEKIIACLLLFAMGLQNAMVTRISNSVVRTTHLTGLFTDLGIELSQTFFYHKSEEKVKLKSSIKLRFTIIGSFFLGCIIGGISYTFLHFYTLLIAATCLLIGILYANAKYRLLLLKKKYTH